MMLKLLALVALAINAAVPSNFDLINSDQADQIMQQVRMNMLVRQALAAQVADDSAFQNGDDNMNGELPEELSDPRMKRGKIFLPTLF